MRHDRARGHASARRHDADAGVTWRHGERDGLRGRCGAWRPAPGVLQGRGAHAGLPRGAARRSGTGPASGSPGCWCSPGPWGGSGSSSSPRAASGRPEVAPRPTAPVRGGIPTDARALGGCQRSVRACPPDRLRHWVAAVRLGERQRADRSFRSPRRRSAWRAVSLVILAIGSLRLDRETDRGRPSTRPGAGSPSLASHPAFVAACEAQDRAEARSGTPSDSGGAGRPAWWGDPSARAGLRLARAAARAVRGGVRARGGRERRAGGRRDRSDGRRGPHAGRAQGPCGGGPARRAAGHRPGL